LEDDDRAVPGDGNPGNPQPSGNPGAEGDAQLRERAEQRTPEQDSQAKPGEGEGERPDGEAAADPADPQAAKDESKPKPKSRYQRRVETLTRERDTAARRADYYRTQAERGGQLRELDPLAFNSDAAYQRALIQQSSKQSRAEFARGEAQAAAEQAVIVEQEIWDARVGEYEEAVPDFKAVAYSSSVQYSQHGLQMLRQLDEGPRVAYFLGKNTAEAHRISQLPPLQTAFELGRIAQRLTGPPKKVVSQAPNPVPTVRARGAAVGYRPDSDDMDAYHAWRDKLPN